MEKYNLVKKHIVDNKEIIIKQITEKLQEFITFKHKDLLKKYNFKNKEELVYPTTIKLMEEMGELSEAILHKNALQRKSKLENKTINIEHEIADVLLVTMLLAKTLNIDIDKALTEKINKIKQRQGQV